jgi:misacylated tRNA(Ala) deacylase
MAIYLCHEQPDLLVHEAEIVAVRPGAVALSRSAFHPGGGGQVSDRGHITWSDGTGTNGTGGEAGVTGIEVDGDVWWHLLEPDVEPGGPPRSDVVPDRIVPDGIVEVRIDGDHRRRVASLHTMSHVLNAFVFDEFAGALVTGAQINGDGTGRMDFDLPAVDNERVRALEAPVNDVIGRGLAVRSVYVDAGDADAVAGLVRSMSVAPPPTPDGLLRIIDIDGLDRQACGGTHLSNTGESPLIRITKVENKGRHNRRVRFAFADQ